MRNVLRVLGIVGVVGFPVLALLAGEWAIFLWFVAFAGIIWFLIYTVLKLRQPPRRNA